jgi:spermidine/putrescine transport system ATP-binding protein
MVELRNVTKRFDRFTAVDQVSLQIQAGEFLTLLGPSGCGKTTLLRMISGFETPTEGEVWIDGVDVTFDPPYKRNVNQVFQSYALFPHLNVEENIAFGLRMQGLSKPEIARRVQDVVALVSLGGMEQRKPGQMSGGQRQRVALARAIVCRPKVLLLDEPLSALDAKLRDKMQIELKRLQEKLGITFVFVTHDQEEALTMSDRIAIINHGRVEQLASASEIYHSPKTRFVANFIGEANLMDAEVIERNGHHARIRIETGLELAVPPEYLREVGDKPVVSIRPEKIRLSRVAGTSANTFPVRIEQEIFKGAMAEIHLVTETGLELTAAVTHERVHVEPYRRGESVYAHVYPEDIVVLEP